LLRETRKLQEDRVYGRTSRVFLKREEEVTLPTKGQREVCGRTPIRPRSVIQRKSVGPRIAKRGEKKTTQISTRKMEQNPGKSEEELFLGQRRQGAEQTSGHVKKMVWRRGAPHYLPLPRHEKKKFLDARATQHELREANRLQI